MKKIIIVSFFIAISFIIEFIVHALLKGNCFSSLLKIEWLPLFLIGLLFGFKFSFWSNLFYIILHTIYEISHIYSEYEFFSCDMIIFISLILFVFVIPYLACSVTGLFYRKDSKYNILKSIVLMSLVQLGSYIIFSYVCNSNEHVLKHFLKDFIPIFNNYDMNIFSFLSLYYLVFLLLNNIVLCFFSYLVYPVLKENICNLE